MSKIAFLDIFILKKNQFCVKKLAKFQIFSEYGSITKNAKECKGSDIIFLEGICVTSNRGKIGSGKTRHWEKLIGI